MTFPVRRQTIVNITEAKLAERRLYRSNGDSIVELDSGAFAEEVAIAIETQAGFDANNGASFNPQSVEHQALACLRDFVHNFDGADMNLDARDAIALLIKKAGMR